MAKRTQKAQLHTQFNDAKESLGFLIWKASNKLQRMHRLGLKGLDLTPTQFSVLASIVYMCPNHDEATQSLLCQHTQMDKMLVSDIAKSLARKKLIKKSKSLKDSRSFSITPTSLGITVVNKAIRVVEDIDEKFFSRVKKRSQFHKDLIQVLEEET